MADARPIPEELLFPGPEGKPTRRAVQELSRTMPIARAVRRVMNSDFAT